MLAKRHGPDPRRSQAVCLTENYGGALPPVEHTAIERSRSQICICHLTVARCIAPGHQRLTCETGVTVQQNPCARPAAADLDHDPRPPLQGHRCWTVALGRQHTAAADVARQIVIAAAIAVEKPALLMARRRIVRRIECRRMTMHLQSSAWIAAGLWRVASASLSSSRFNVDLPTNGVRMVDTSSQPGPMPTARAVTSYRSSASPVPAFERR